MMKKQMKKQKIKNQVKNIGGEDLAENQISLNISKKIKKACIKVDDMTEMFRQRFFRKLDFFLDRENYVKFREKLYRAYTIWDDSSEEFRNVVTDLLDDGINLVREASDFVVAIIKSASREEMTEHHLKKYRTHIFRLYNLELVHHKLVKKIERKIDKIAEAMIVNRRSVTMASSTILCVFMVFCVTVNAGTVYNYSYHGKALGTVKNKAEITEATDIVKEDITAATGTEVDVKADPEEDITYEKSFNISAIVGNKEVDSTEEAASKIANCKELEGSGYVIRIDGVDYAYVDTEATAKKILSDVKKNYCTVFDDPADEVMDKLYAKEASNEGIDSEDLSENTESSTVDPAITRNIILAQVSKKSALVSADSEAVDTETGAIDALANTDDEEFFDDSENPEKYAGIDFSSIDPTTLEGVSADNVSFREKVEILPVTDKVSKFMDYDKAKELFIDENGNSKALTVKTSEIMVYKAPVPFMTVYENSDDLFEGEQEVVTPGVEGEKDVVAYITKEGGVEVGSIILHEKMTKDAITSVVKVGTKSKPSTEPTGHFIVPTNGHLSSHFGPRWGRFHYGLDIANSYGADIVAADGGTVTYAGFNSGGYGYLVKISHGNGMETRYGHCSKILVSVGDKVTQGQLIAKVGNTGRSYGNHCHFEIRINGVAVDPLKYL